MKERDREKEREREREREREKERHRTTSLAVCGKSGLHFDVLIGSPNSLGYSC